LWQMVRFSNLLSFISLNRELKHRHLVSHGWELKLNVLLVGLFLLPIKGKKYLVLLSVGLPLRT